MHPSTAYLKGKEKHHEQDGVGGRLGSRTQQCLSATFRIEAAVARCAHASKPLIRDCASTIPWKANPLTQHLILTYLAEGVGFEPTEHKPSGFQDQLLKPLGQPSRSSWFSCFSQTSKASIYASSIRSHWMNFFSTRRVRCFTPLGHFRSPLAPHHRVKTLWRGLSVRQAVYTTGEFMPCN